MNQQYKRHILRKSILAAGAVFSAAMLSFSAKAQTDLPVAWMKGSNQISQTGTYGTINIPAAANTPGARYGSATLTLPNGKMLMFAGQGSGPATAGALNDIWQYDPAVNQWAWIKGAAGINQTAVFGTRGTAADANTPGGRRTFAYTKDRQGRLWIFGGLGYGVSTGGSTYQNDLWRYDPATNQWTWIKGNNEAGVFANYGIQGTSAATNIPGGRYGGLSWMDKDGNFWLFGGYGYTTLGGAGYLNDLWKYNPVTDQWTWMKGSNILSQPAGYGLLGIPSVNTTPGGRYGGGNYWSDAAGNFYLFGGYGYALAIGYLNDLWKYSPATNEWTWINGTQKVNENTTGVYGTKGTAAPENIPGGRRYPMIWKDNGDNIWLAGGYGYPATGTTEGALNDVWKYNAVTNQWIWMYFDNTINTYGVYGTVETASINNKPGGRIGSAAWRDNTGNVWFFGGQGFGASTGSVFSNLNDLWKLQLNLAPLVDSIDVTVAGNLAPVINTHAGTLQMTATVFPSNVSQAVTWSIVPASGNASVSTGGFVTGVASGTVWVKAVSVADPTKKDSVLVTLSGQAIAGDAQVMVYPNPAKDVVNIKIRQQHPALSITLSDAQGKLLMKKAVVANALTQPLSFDLRSLPKGMYFIRLKGAGFNIDKALRKL